MTRLISCLICIFLGLILSFSVQAQETELVKDYAIGFHGATPAFGGISFRYCGLAPVYLQTVGRFILLDQESDHMLGAGISYAIFEKQTRLNIARLYFALQGGWRYKTEGTLQTTTLGAGLAFGGELVFSLGGIPLGLNLEIGQGFGRENASTEWSRPWSRSDPMAGVYVGAGIHAYF